jgi:hypothetical protein
MNHARSLSLVVAMLACALPATAGPRQTTDAPTSWPAFWASKNVDPAPPENFLDIAFKGRIENFTDGRVTDETARRWVLADLRRSMGDLYATHNLREDIADAGVFGPPGLNGTTDLIRQLRANGVERIDAPLMADFLAAAVIAVPKETLARSKGAGLTDYVIVLMFRPMSADAIMVYRDGRNEAVPGGKLDEVHWQLDAGHYFEHPTVGPLWFQSKGWSCRPDDTVVGKLCGKLKPR